MMDAVPETVEAEIAGQKFKASAQNLNHLATFASLVLICVAITGGYILLTAHTNDTREAWKELVGAIKEQTNATKDAAQSQRESNCLSRFEGKERLDRADFCKSISR